MAQVYGVAMADKLSRPSLRAKEYIDDHYAERIPLEEIASHAFVAPTHLCMIFRQETGRTVHEYLTEVRMDHARLLLKTTEMTNHEVAIRTGYSESSYFSKAFKRHTGLSPTEYRASDAEGVPVESRRESQL
jgi:two-component system response regulator YesN